jgi:hypothetical protein
MPRVMLGFAGPMNRLIPSVGFRPPRTGWRRSPSQPEPQSLPTGARRGYMSEKGSSNCPSLFKPVQKEADTAGCFLGEVNRLWPD